MILDTLEGELGNMLHYNAKFKEIYLDFIKDTKLLREFKKSPVSRIILSASLK